jgi:hypothetical protein
MSFPVFGPGILIATRTDIANGTPVNIGYCNEFSTDFSGNIKQLFGQNQLPLDAARGTVKVSGKAKAAVVSGLALNAVFFGNNFTTGGIKWNVGESHSVPVTPGPYTVTVNNSATFDLDLGVVYAATNIPFTKVASAPAQGQYSVSAGVYTFAAADQGAAFFVTYTSTVATGIQTLNITNQLLGTSPIFQLDYFTIRNNKALVGRFFAVQASKLGMAFKLEDFMMPEIDFELFANAGGQLANITFGDLG